MDAIVSELSLQKSVKPRATEGATFAVGALRFREDLRIVL
jgi:hypothetical protein